MQNLKPLRHTRNARVFMDLVARQGHREFPIVVHFIAVLSTGCPQRRTVADQAICHASQQNADQIFEARSHKLKFLSAGVDFTLRVR